MAQNWSFVSAGTVATGTSTLTVGVPSSYSAGNTLIIIAAQAGASSGPSTPSGWSSAASTTHFGIFYKTATASESSVSVTAPVTATTSGVMLCYSNLGVFDAASTEATATGATTLATNTLTTTGADDLVLSAWVTNALATSWTAPASTTSRASGLAIPALLVVDEDQSTTGASTARTATTAPSTSIRAVAVAFKNGAARPSSMLLMF